MARVRFVSPSLSFDLTGSEESIERRLSVMFGEAAEPEPEVPEVSEVVVVAPTPPSAELLDEFAVVLRSDPPRGRDAQRLAAIRVATFLAERGHTSLRVADFVRAFLTARVDTRDVFKLLEELASEGLFTRECEGGPYELA